MHIQFCIFKRTAESPLEPGIMLNSNQIIIDAKCQRVEGEIFNYHLHPEHGCINISEIKT